MVNKHSLEKCKNPLMAVAKAIVECSFHVVRSVLWQLKIELIIPMSRILRGCCVVCVINFVQYKNMGIFTFDGAFLYFFIYVSIVLKIGQYTGI